MNWYYVVDNEKVGPIDDAEFNRLIDEGIISDDTLVWTEKFPDWMKLSKLRPSTPKPPLVPSETTEDQSKFGFYGKCTQCGKRFPKNEMIRHGEAYICANCKPYFVQMMREGVQKRTSFYYGGFWIRFGAKFIDGIALSVLGFISSFILSPGLQNPEEFSPAYFGLFAVFYVVNLALTIGYQVFFVGKYGATPGKMVLGLKIINADGSKLTYTKAFVRYLAEILSSLTMNIGYIMAAFDNEKRTLHDRLCETRVVR